MKTKFIILLLLVGVNFSVKSQNETVDGDLRVNGDILNLSGSGGTLTLFDDDAARRNRIILGADDQGAYIRSTWGSGGTDAFSFRNSSSESIFNISKDSKVGIGTTTPTEKLEVQGSLLLKSDSYISYALERGNGARSVFGITSNTHDGFLSSSGNLKFLTNNDGTGNTFTSMFINDKGNVGIGTDNPEEDLEVIGGAQITDYSPVLRLKRDTDEGGFIQGIQTKLYDNSDNFYFGNLHSDEWLISKGAYNGDRLFTVKSDGDVGIGTSSPSQKLDVNGSVKFDQSASNHTNLQIGHDTNDRILADNSSDKFYGGGMFFRITPDPSLNIPHNYIDVMMLTDKGEVGIGTRNTGSHKLAVEVSIGAREIKVEASGWSDFVFEDNYDLPTLKEVEEHITKKGHLQDIPSAVEVEKNGIFLGEMDAKLLQKIEELTLYTIQQEKEIERLKLLEKRLFEIEELLKAKK